MLGAALDFDKSLPGHIAALNLKHANQIRLTQSARFLDFSYILADFNILLDFLFHNETRDGLNLFLIFPAANPQIHAKHLPGHSVQCL